MPVVVLVRYGELALKSPPVRREFERTLSRNILAQFAANASACRIHSDGGHFYLETDDPGAAARLLRRVFGVTSVSVVHETTSDLPAIASAVREFADAQLSHGASFAIRARRTGQHAFTSQELGRDLGAVVLATWPDRALHVDLGTPDVEIFVEVRGPKAYLSFDRVRGPGGLPIGVAGRLAALVDGRRAALGAWLMMKRGCQCSLVATATGAPLVREVLQRFDPKSDAPRLVTDEDASEALRRLADEVKADGIVLPLSIDEYPAARGVWGDRVVFSPTVGWDDAEVENRWRAVIALSS
ncbi:MAG: THUMP domain-containing protein [Thermoplasmata archaeon]|nr:THUMP domain-containing protein [Thermoplasmata archaeon]